MFRIVLFKIFTVDILSFHFVGSRICSCIGALLSLLGLLSYAKYSGIVCYDIHPSEASCLQQALVYQSTSVRI